MSISPGLIFHYLIALAADKQKAKTRNLWIGNNNDNNHLPKSPFARKPTIKRKKDY